MSNGVKIKSALGEVTSDRREIGHWTVDDQSSFGIPADASVDRPDDHPPPGPVTNPLYAQMHPEMTQQQPRPENFQQNPGGFQQNSPPQRQGIYPRQQPQQQQPYPQQQQPYQTGPTTVDSAMEMRDEFARQAAIQHQQDQHIARRRIDMLIGFGVSSEDYPITIDGRTVTFTLRTLKHREQKQVTAFVDSHGQFLPDGAVMMKRDDQQEMRMMCLVFSLTHVDGVEFDDILGVHGLKMGDILWKRRQVLEELDDVLKLKIFEKFDILTGEHNKKYNPKTDAEVQEVAEQLTKSGKRPA